MSMGKGVNFVPTGQRICIVDDDPFAAHHYRQGLQLAGFQVEHLLDAASAFEMLHKAISTPDFLIVDVMMERPWSEISNQSWNDEITGLYVAKAFRDKFPDIPVLIVSNSQLDQVTSLAKNFSRSRQLCMFVPKHELLPRMLETLLIDWFQFKRFRKRLTPSTIWRRFIESIEAKPNFAGIGIDLKALFPK